MDFRIGKNELLRGLYLTHGIADRKNTIPILANVLVRASGKDKVIFAATDLKVAMIVNTSAKVSEEGGITVGARQLYEIVKGLGRRRGSSAANGAKLAAHRKWKDGIQGRGDERQGLPQAA
jgi:DNA polymerase III sliding clamp (beta) subunit (PCNA family)